MAVVFVNIGWSRTYDGGRVEGSHAWLRSPHGQDTHGCAEDRLFVPDDNQTRLGPLGVGSTPEGVRLDVVFVARQPRKTRHKIVAWFRECSVEPNYLHPTFLMARSGRAVCLEPRERVVITWPGRMSMRRWAHGGKKNWRTLQQSYKRLIHQHGD